MKPYAMLCNKAAAKRSFSSYSKLLHLSTRPPDLRCYCYEVLHCSTLNRLWSTSVFKITFQMKPYVKLCIQAAATRSFFVYTILLGLDTSLFIQLSTRPDLRCCS